MFVVCLGRLVLTAVVRRAGSFIFDAAQRKQGEGVGGLARYLAGKTAGQGWGDLGENFSVRTVILFGRKPSSDR